MEVFSLDGRRMLSEIIPEGSRQYLLDVSSLATGSYLVILRDKSGIAARRQLVRD